MVSDLTWLTSSCHSVETSLTDAEPHLRHKDLSCGYNAKAGAHQPPQIGDLKAPILQRRHPRNLSPAHQPPQHLNQGCSKCISSGSTEERKRDLDA
eukprot:657722-Amphidinium_carterae.1